MKCTRQSARLPADKGNGPIPIIHATRFPAFRPISLPPSLQLQNLRFVSVCFAPPTATDGTAIFPSPESFMVTIHSCVIATPFRLTLVQTSDRRNLISVATFHDNLSEF